MSHIFTSFNANISSPLIFNVAGGGTAGHISLTNTAKACLHHHHHHLSRCTRSHSGHHFTSVTKLQQEMNQQTHNHISSHGLKN